MRRRPATWGRLATVLAAAAVVVPVLFPALAQAAPLRNSPIQEDTRQEDTRQEDTRQEDAGPGAPGTSLTLIARPPWVGATDLAEFVVAIDDPPEGTTVVVRVHDALDSVEQLSASTSEDVGPVVFSTPPLPLDLLAPGPDEGTAVVGLRTAGSEVTGPGDAFTARLTEPGVHPVVIDLRGPDGDVLAEVRTPVVALGEDVDPADRPRLGVLLDIGAPPSLTPDGDRRVPSEELLVASTVAGLLVEHSELGLSTVVVPDTLDALAARSDPDAAAVLAALAGRDLVSTPYLRLDVESLLEVDLIGLLPTARERAVVVVRDLLATTPRTDIWDPAGELTNAGAGLLTDLGIEQVLLPARPLVDASDDEEGDGATGAAEDRLVDPGPRPTLGLGDLRALTVDDGYSERVATTRPDVVDAAHVALADLVLRLGPESGARVLVRPGTELAPESVLDGLLALLDDARAPVVAGGLDVLDAGVADDASTPPVEVIAGRSTADLEEIAPRVRDARTELRVFERLLGDQSSRGDGVRLQILTAVAAGTEPAARVAAIDAAEAALTSGFAAVRLNGERDLNLTSRRGTLPVTVVNDNPFGIDVVVRIRSDRLGFPDGERFEVRVTGDRQRIDVPVEALATGSVPVFVELWTPDEARLLDQRQLNVRSTAVSGVGLVLSAGALVVLVVWWARSWRRSRATAAAETSHPTRSGR